MRLRAPGFSCGLAAFLAGVVMVLAFPAAAGDPAPGGADELLSLRAVAIDGDPRLPGDELQSLIASLIGRPVRVEEVEAFRHRISQRHVELGYISSGAVYADPAVQDGVLQLRIVEGRVSEFALAGNERLAPGYVHDRLVRDGPLNVRELQERYQLLLADPLFSRIGVRLAPAPELGAARLEVEVERARPWQLSAYANNHRSASTGEGVLGVAALVRNLSAYGDALDLFVQASRGAAHRSGVGWQLPIGARGPQLSVRYEAGDAAVIEAPLDRVDIESRLRASEIGLAQALVERLDLRFALGLAYAERVNATTLLGEPFSFVAGEPSGTSRVRVWRFSQEFMHRGRESVAALRSTFSVGRSNTRADDPADPFEFPARDFAHWVGQAQLVWRPAGKAWRVEARAVAQKAQDRLVPLEQFALGGVATVRGYRENSLVRDNGHALTLAWHWALPTAALAGWELALFHDRGAAWNRNQDRRQLRSLGLALAYRMAGWSFDIAWAHRLDPRASVEGSGLQDRGVHVALRFTY